MKTSMSRIQHFIYLTNLFSFKVMSHDTKLIHALLEYFFDTMRIKYILFTSVL